MKRAMVLGQVEPGVPVWQAMLDYGQSFCLSDHTNKNQLHFSLSQRHDQRADRWKASEEEGKNVKVCGISWKCRRRRRLDLSCLEAWSEGEEADRNETIE